MLTSFDAQPGDRLIAAIDLRGRYREPFSNWDAATDAPAARLRGDLELLPQIAEAGLCRAAKDISQGGIVGTATDAAGVLGRRRATIDVTAIPRPDGVPLERWLQTFPELRLLLAVPPRNVDAVLERFAARGIACGAVGACDGRATGSRSPTAASARCCVGLRREAADRLRGRLAGGRS